MLGVWDKWGVRYPVSVLSVDNCQVVQAKTRLSCGYTALQLGVGEAKLKRVNKPLLGHYDAVKNYANTHSEEKSYVVNRKLMEFHVSDDCLLEPGTPIFATHFVPGQLVDICGISKGKGFQGAMKRHNFAGGRASHGNSLNHRTLGSTGCRQDPGKVFKGKKMPGRMGGDVKTIQNMKILKIDVSRNLIYVKGSVPGQKGAFLRVSDAVKGPFFPPAAVATDPSKFSVSDNIYTPYPVPIPTMSSSQRALLIQSLQQRHIQQVQKMQMDAAKAGGKNKSAKLNVEETSAKVDAILSLWASTAGVNRSVGQLNNVEQVQAVEVAGIPGAAEIDPVKGVEVTDPYAL
jgi:large subunit ribosomal protein L3